jgi:hypothetical protein
MTTETTPREMHGDHDEDETDDGNEHVAPPR